ncbi:uncharacterized protein [Rutidosis leptorrhynchoides]|uniref:uncharacterized protein n=1 Tax=Rutidosis leptorrhynchoides TaxID=125765 RepID=UPI003A9A50E3
MEESVNFIWSKVFQTEDPTERKPIESVNVFIDDLKDGDKGVALMWGGNNINFSNTKIETYTGEGAWDVKKEFTAVMYHEMTHVLQWGGDGTANPGLQEGSADYTKIKADLMQPGFAKPGTGDKWDHGYGETARFLEYCDSVTPDFVAKLYKKMKTSYDDSYFQELTGKPVDELWKDYKAKYADGNKPGPARRLSSIYDYST